MYASLEQETGLATGWKGVGFIELASDKDRLEEYMPTTFPHYVL
jgi:hypothetical protein